MYSTHTVGDLRIGPDGALYASGGDGSSFTFADYGQLHDSGPTPANACGDPPVPVGADQSPPIAEGGALRSQSFRRPAGEAVSLDGSVIRVNPDTGDAMPDNPAAGDANANRRRIVAHGFLNPFRFAFRPGTGELWTTDVGWNTWEEVNRDPTPRRSATSAGRAAGNRTTRWPLSASVNLTAGTNGDVPVLNPTGSADVLRWR